MVVNEMKIKELIKQLTQIENEGVGISDNEVVLESLDAPIPRLIVLDAFFDHELQETTILVALEGEEDD